MKNADTPANGYVREIADYYEHRGLTKREYAAIAFMQALIRFEGDPLMAALLQYRSEQINLSNPEWIATLKAKTALIYADALFNEIGDGH